MIERDGIRFNCCESTIIKVNEQHPLKGFGVGVIRAASNMGGGGAGWGSMCGAVSGAVMAFGLAMGTEGNETPEEFTANRKQPRWSKRYPHPLSPLQCAAVFHGDDGK